MTDIEKYYIYKMCKMRKYHAQENHCNKYKIQKKKNQ